MASMATLAWGSGSRMRDRMASLTTRYPVALPVLAAAIAVLAFVLLRLLLAADGDPSKFVVAGSLWADVNDTPRSLFVFPDSNGYDGQFYWRLAADPSNYGLAPHLGVGLDVPVRLNRPVYPLLSWAFAGGRVSLVPISLIVVNVLALLGLARLGVAAARERGISPWWGLTLLLTPGLVGALSRDLTEIVATTALVAGMLAMRQKRWAWAALAWTIAALTRETSAAVLAAYLVVAAYEILRRRRRFAMSDLGWVIPLVAMAVWQILVSIETGSSPLTSSSDSNVGAPMVGLVQAIGDWFNPRTFVRTSQGAILVAQLIAAVLIVGAGLRAGVRDSRRPAEVLGCAFAVVPVLLGSRNPWAANLDLRLASDAMVIAWLLLLASSPIQRLRPLTIMMGFVMLATVAQRLIVI
jgi:hypothetical protein